MQTFFRMIAKDVVAYAEDGKSIIEDLTPIGVTSDLMTGWELEYDIDDSAQEIYCRIQNLMHYALYQEIGTDPFKAKLIPVRLSRTQQKSVKELKGRLVRDRYSPLFLAPVWFKDWGPKVRKGPPRDQWSKEPWRSPAVNYVNSWRIWWKIARKGITGKHFAHRGVEIMRQQKALYPLAQSTGARVVMGGFT